MKNDLVSLQRRPFLTPIILAALAVFAGFVIVSFATWYWSTAHSTTVVVVRHAEKDLSAGDDPPLTDAGKARAVSLAHLFGDGIQSGRIDAIYISPTLRSKLTAEPLAAELHITPTTVPADDPAALARRVLRDHPGGRVLIVGHSDTVPAIVAALTGDDTIPPIADTQYGILYIVTVPKIGHANYLRLSY